MLAVVAEAANMRQRHMPCTEHRGGVALAKRRKACKLAHKLKAYLGQIHIEFIPPSRYKHGVVIVFFKRALHARHEFVKAIPAQGDACGLGMTAEAFVKLRMRIQYRMDVDPLDGACGTLEHTV